MSSPTPLTSCAARSPSRSRSRRSHHGLRSTTALEPARTTGDPQLVERLGANLVANPVRHNIPGGWLDIVRYPAAGRATFTIANAHDATLTPQARTGGGLGINVAFPAFD
jgi:ribosomal protein L32